MEGKKEENSASAAYGHVFPCARPDGHAILQRLLKTCTEMLLDRGCQQVRTVGSAETAASEPLLLGTGGPVDYVVYFSLEERVGIKAARVIMERHSAEEGGEPVHVIVVSPLGATPCTKKECAQAMGRRIQFFQACHLVTNITHHVLVPKHEVVKYPPFDVDVDQLPRILESDPVVQYYAWPVGTVLRTERPFGGSEPIPYYRVVVPAVA